MRGLFAFLALLGASIDASAASSAPRATISLQGPTHARHVPVGSRVTFIAHGAYYFVDEPFTMEIAVPGRLVRVEGIEGFFFGNGLGVTCRGRRPVICTVPGGFPGFYNGISVSSVILELGTQTASVTTRTSAGAQFTSSVTVDAVDRPSLSISGLGEDFLDPTESARSTITVLNDGTTASNATLTLTLPDGGTFTNIEVASNNATCTIRGAEAVCKSPSLPWGKTIDLAAYVTAPDHLDGGELTLAARATSDEPDVNSSDNEWQRRITLMPHLLVTNTADAGSGSLRQALLDASARCRVVSCVVDFRIPPPVPASGWFTIRPKSPLPEVWGRVSIDGGTQREFIRYTNRYGPMIEIDGSLLEAGSGLVLRTGCGQDVRGLAINGFPGPGIEVRTSEPQTCRYWPLISENLIGTDPLRDTPLPNGSGILFAEGKHVLIERNLIRNNRGDGIAIVAGEYAMTFGNEILHNGGRGIFLDLGGDYCSTGGGADLQSDTVAFNGECGICRTTAGAINISQGYYGGNGGPDIDIGGDRETSNAGSDFGTFPNKPVLFSATYDPTKKTTTVRGRLDSEIEYCTRCYARFEISIYATYAGEVSPRLTEHVWSESVEDGHADFEIEIEIPIDLRKSVLTATNTRNEDKCGSSDVIGYFYPFFPPKPDSRYYLSDTSEFSNSIEVR